MSLNKKIFYISSGFLAILLIFWGIYNFAFKKPAVPELPTTSENQAPQKTTEEKQIAPISEEAVLSPVIDESGSHIKYYAKETGKVYSVDFEGETKQTIYNKNLPGLVAVFWSPSKTKVISKFINGGKTTFSIYDYSISKGFSLNENIDSVAWQSENKIVYKFYDTKKKEASLNIADFNGTNWQRLATANFRYLSIAPVPKTGLLSFWNYPDAFRETSFQTTPIIGGETKTLLTGKFGGDFLWNNSGSTVLVSHSDTKQGTKIQLATINDRGGEYKNLGIPTFVSKAIWSKDNKTIFYALPGSIPDNSILPNDYQDNKFTTVDTFWKVDVTTGEKNRIIDLNKISGRFDATNLFLNADESKLFFINRLDGKLYRIDL